MIDSKDLNPDTPLTQYCRNVSNRKGDTFVGIKYKYAHDTHKLTINFPLGYKISDSEEDVRDDILSLVSVLQEYGDEESRLSKILSEQMMKTVNFPIQAYMVVIMDYINNGYYKITEKQFKSQTSGFIHWSRTIKQERPMVTRNGFVYSTFKVKQRSKIDTDLITEISKYCVYQSHLRIGWLYNFHLPEKPQKPYNLDLYRKHLYGFFLETNFDKDKILFQAMLDIINFENTIDNPEQLYFGTNNFEYIWERMIQATFGNVNKEYYFPRTKWLLRIGSEKENSALQPDTVMQQDKDIYILDAKYYKYGITRCAKDLPNSSSINKQISYGEHVATAAKFESKRQKGMKIYNAFLLPYDSTDELYVIEEHSRSYYSIGEGVSEWKDSENTYERIQGILVDVKLLMKNRLHPNISEIIKLSNCIKKSIELNDSDRQ